MAKPVPQPMAYEEPPPPYYYNNPQITSRQLYPNDTAFPPTPYQTPSYNYSSSLPVVIPQKSKPFLSTFNSPFARAYSQTLTSHNLSRNDFLTFLDGLNECWISSPVFQGTTFAGQVMQMAHGVPPVQWAGVGLSVASGAASAGTSYFRTRAYVKEMNRDLFNPAGLRCRILGTKEMLKVVGFQGETLSLEAMAGSSAAGADGQGATQRGVERWLEALQGYVAPLEFDNIPAAGTPDNLLKRMGAAQAKRMAEKADRKNEKRSVKDEEKNEKHARKGDRRQRKLDSELAKLQQELEKLCIKRDRDLEKETSQRKRQKVLDDFEKEKRKVERDMEKEEEKAGRKADKRTEKREKPRRKEEKAVNGVRWVVLVKWTGEESLEEEEDDVESEGSENGSERSIGGWGYGDEKRQSEDGRAFG